MRRTMVSVLAAGLAGCMMNVIAHDPQSAANAASEFAQVAFIDRNDAKAHGLLAPAAAAQSPLDQFSEIIDKMHPTGFPEKITATEYEPMPGQRGMMIYLNGVRAGEESHYRFVMEGDRRMGYRVLTARRGSGPYPPSRRMPLK